MFVISVDKALSLGTPAAQSTFSVSVRHMWQSAVHTYTVLHVKADIKIITQNAHKCVISR